MSDKPIVLMPEDVQRILGKDAQRNNIMAAKMVADVVKTTLGPKGMDKMLVSPTGEIIVTNDGVTILKEMQIEHPAAKMMVDIAKTQDTEVGDGTTTVTMLAGKLLENAEKLLDMKVHPTVIVKGYRMAAEKAQEILGEVSLKITNDSDDVLKQIAMTSMTGKVAEGIRSKLAEISVEAVKQIKEGDNINLKNIKIVKVKGDGTKDAELVSGIVLDKEKASSEMPSKVKGAKIAILDFGLEIKNPEIDTKISITSPDQLQNFLNQEENTIKKMVMSVVDSGANVVFCQKGIDDFAQYLLSKQGIYSCKRVSSNDLSKISKATGARAVSNIGELSRIDLGKAQIVEEVNHGEETFTYIRGCENPKAMTIIIYGGTDHVIEETERVINDSLGVIASVLRTGLVVPGGGAIEIEVARRLRHFGQSLSGREQLAVEEFASALEYIPLTLAENAGLDPIEVLTELKSVHDSGEKNFGLNLFNNKIENVLNSKIIEPYKTKSQAISSACEVATMILRIDDVIASSSRGGPPRGGMGGMGSMPY